MYRGTDTGIKWQGREADHSSPSGANVMNGGTVLPLPHTSSWRDAYLSKTADNFTFTHTSIFVFIAVLVLCI
jgi:hypothetical protein